MPRLYKGPLYTAEKFGILKKIKVADGPCGACIPKSENMELRLLDVLVSVLLDLELVSVHIHPPYLSSSLAARGYQIFIPCS